MGGGGGGGMNWEIGIDMYTLICIKWMTNKNLLYKKINKIKFKKKKKEMLWGHLARRSLFSYSFPRDYFHHVLKMLLAMLTA